MNKVPYILRNIDIIQAPLKNRLWDSRCRFVVPADCTLHPSLEDHLDLYEGPAFGK